MSIIENLATYILYAYIPITDLTKIILSYTRDIINMVWDDALQKIIITKGNTIYVLNKHYTLELKKTTEIYVEKIVDQYYDKETIYLVIMNPDHHIYKICINHKNPVEKINTDFHIIDYKHGPNYNYSITATLYKNKINIEELKHNFRRDSNLIAKDTYIDNYKNMSIIYPSDYPVLVVLTDTGQIYTRCTYNRELTKSIQVDPNAIIEQKYMAIGEKLYEFKITDNYIMGRDKLSGTNMTDVRNIHGIDLNKTITNDVIQIYNTFGIEAARTSILIELRKVFDTNAVYVNHHNLSILVDIMTNTGSLISIDRHGINKLDVDPLARASFEKTVEQLLTAAIFGEVDKMKSVSSLIMAGRAIKGGTGLCDIMLDTPKLENMEYVEEYEKKTFNELTDNVMINDIFNRKEQDILMID